MNSKSTWRLFFAAVAMFAFIWFFERNQPVHTGGGEALIFSKIAASSVTGVEIQTTNYTLRAERTNDAWRLTRPFYPAQSTPIDAFVNAMTKLPQRDVIPASVVSDQVGKLRDYGLESPAAILTISQGTNRHYLHLGALTPLRDQVYVMMPGSGEVLVTDATILRAIPPTVNAWRSPMVVNLRDRAFDHVQIRAGQRVLEFELDITNLVWRLSKPTPARANDPLVRQLFHQIEATRVKEFVTDSPAADLERYGLQTPQLELSFLLDTNRVTAIEFGGSPTNDPASVYVRRLSTTNIVLIDRLMLDALSQPAKTFHDPRLISFDPNQITMLQVKSATPFALVRQTNGVWTINEPNPMPADAELVGRFLTNFFKLPIENFAKDVPTDAELKEFGLAPARSSYAFYAIRTNAAGVLTNALVTQVDFGNSTPEGLMYARRSDETPVYQTYDVASMALLPTASWRLRDRQILNISPTNIAAIVLTAGGKTNRTARTAQGWTSDLVRNAALEATIEQLCSLRAYDWVDKGTKQMPALGFQKGSFTLEIEMTAGGPQTPSPIMFGKPGVRDNINAATYLPGEVEPTLFLFPRALYDTLTNAFGGSGQ
jgi:hypothetical protein